MVLLHWIDSTQDYLDDLIQSKSDTYSLISSFGCNVTMALTASLVTANLDVLKEEVDRLEQAEDGSYASYARVLRACSKAKALGEGKRLHTLILRSQVVKQEPFLWSHLVKMYLECGSLADARAVFDGMFQRDLMVWTYMVAAYVRQGHPREAIGLFQWMLLEGVSPDRITLVTVLNACSNLLEGKLVHAVIVEEGFQREAIVGTAVVKMYGRCGTLEDAHLVFSSIFHPDVVAWTTVLAAYAQNGHFKETFQLLEDMEREGVRPNKITFVTLLSSIGPEALEEGAQIHARIKEHGYESDLIVGNAIVNMYRKCRSLDGARKMFDKMPKRNLISWTALLGAYVEHSCYDEAFHLFEQMQIKGLTPDRVCLTTMLNACASPAALEKGKMIHAAIIKHGFESSMVVGNALLNMYGKCGSLEDACRVFKSINQRNMVTWTTMIGAYVEHGSWKDALHLFRLVQLEGLVLSKVTFVTILNASSGLAFLAAGRLIHSCILEQGYELDTIVGTALINMYGKCGILSDARKVFDKMAEKDLVAWNAMVAVYAQHGHESEALKLFQEMQQAGVKPDTITLVIVLFACSHAGLLEDGLHIFGSMAEQGITPAVEHYGCVIDLLGRAGCLNEAENLIERMPLRPNAPVWRTLLGASRVHRDFDCGRRAAEQVLKLEPQNDAVHVVLSHIWSSE